VPAMFEPLSRIVIGHAAPKPGEHVLDVACGTGIVARSVAPLVGGSGRIVGLDFDPLMVDTAKRLAPEIEWQQGDLQKLPFADAQFDLVMCQQGLQFLPDRTAGLWQIHRVLSGGGRVVLATWTELAKCPGHAVLFGALGKLLGIDMSRPPAWSLADKAEVLKLVTTSGFGAVETSVVSLCARFPSARRFVEMMIGGSSKLTRQALAQIPAARRDVFIDDVATDLHVYETSAGLELPLESRLLVAYKR